MTLVTARIRLTLEVLSKLLTIENIFLTLNKQPSQTKSLTLQEKAVLEKETSPNDPSQLNDTEHFDQWACIPGGSLIGNAS